MGVIGQPGAKVQIGRMKTSNLKTYSAKLKELENSQDQIFKSKYDINQYNQIKSVLLNMSFVNKGSKTLCVDIIESVMDELRRERKIRMVLADADIEEYIKLDLSGEHNNEDDKNASDHLKLVLEDKKEFKANLCQKVSIIRLGYMLKVLYAVHPGKASMLGADAYLAKVKKEEKAARLQQKRENGLASGMGVSSVLGTSSMGSMDYMAGQGDGGPDITDPVLKNIDQFVKDLKQKIVDASKDHVKALNSIIGLSNKQMHQDTIEENLQMLERKKGTYKTAK